MQLFQNVYNDLTGYGSIKETTKNANPKDNNIKYIDVKEWF